MSPPSAASTYLGLHVLILLLHCECFVWLSIHVFGILPTPPCRLTAAMKKFVTSMIGAKYVTSQPYDLEASFKDSAPGTPIFVFLSPGVDVVRALTCALPDHWVCQTEPRTVQLNPQTCLEPS